MCAQRPWAPDEPCEVDTGGPMADDETGVKRSFVKCQSTLSWLTAPLVRELKLVLFFNQEK